MSPSRPASLERAFDDSGCAEMRSDSSERGLEPSGFDSFKAEDELGEIET